MTARQLLELNGDFRHSPLIETARRLHAAFSRAGADYAIVGGLAVARNGAVRTTEDVDVLTERARLGEGPAAGGAEFDFGVDKATDRASGVEVDCALRRRGLGPSFNLSPLCRIGARRGARGAVHGSRAPLELKCAVYLSKKAHEGMELAAKDLADVVHLMQANPQRIGEPLFAGAHPAVRDELNRIWRSIKGKGGTRRRPGRR